MKDEQSFVRRNIGSLLPNWMTVVWFVLIAVFIAPSTILFLCYAPIFFYLFYRAANALSKEQTSYWKKALHLIILPFLIGAGFFILVIGFEAITGINIFTVFHK